MQNRTIKLWAAGLALLTCSTVQSDETKIPSQPLTRIVFGSCIKQDQPTPIFYTMSSPPPELLLFTGDNIYGDTDDMAIMRSKYSRLAANPAFAKLVRLSPVMATWDDHDYGVNDGGADFAKRNESQKEFADFWRLPAKSPVRSRAGVYDTRMFGPAGKRTQVILLDTRYFRSKLKHGTRRVGGPYLPDADASKTMLGDAQWHWLDQQLRKPAQLRIIVSSIQFVASAAGQECWANLPTERMRMLELIQSTKANGVIFISGDRHWSEFSAIKANVPYPIYDITCSSLNQLHARGTPTHNEFRVNQTTYHRENYGVLSVDWDAADPELRISIRDMEAAPRIETTLRLSELSQ